MTDIRTFFDGNRKERGAYLSRIFGIFNEEIIKIWAHDQNSYYKIHEKRPTLYDGEKPYTLDFTFIKDSRLYVSEMKCEIEYQNYKFWKLHDPEKQFKHHQTKRAFQLFLNLSKNPGSVPVKAGDSIEAAGTILVWGAATEQGKRIAKEKYRIFDVITIEECIDDLVNWKNSEYLELINDRNNWSNEFFEALKTNQWMPPAR